MSEGEEVKVGIEIVNHNLARIVFQKVPSGVVFLQTPPVKLPDAAAIAGTIMQCVMNAAQNDKQMTAAIAAAYHRGLGHPMMGKAVGNMVKGKQ